MEQRPSVSGFASLQKFEQAIAAGESFDLVLLDLGIPGYSHLESLHHFRALAPITPVVVISGSDERETILEALDLGAMGFIPKTSQREVLMRALIHRRVAVIAQGIGDVLLIGCVGSGATLRIKQFLTRNGHPFKYLEAIS